MTTETRDRIQFNPSDFDSLLKLMDTYGDQETMLFGINESKESVDISIFKDRILVGTYQHNGWKRKNVYWRDGTVEELFEGRHNL